MNARLGFALVLLVVGVAWILDVSGRAIFPGGIAAWWPSLLILLGVVQLAFAGRRWRGPVVLIALGAFLQAWTLGYVPDDWWMYAAPAALIFLAILLLLPPYKTPWTGRPGHVHHEARAGHLGPEDVSVFSDQHLAAPQGSEYRGGELTAVFGALDADLTRAKLPPEGARMKATSVFGGLTIRVPATWRVEVRGTPFAGQTANRTAAHADGPKLDIEAVAVFGNVEVVNG